MLKKLHLEVIAALVLIQTTQLLTQSDSHKIGNLIWHNEASGRLDYLVFWSPHEDFPSLGIGHFIWIPENQTAPYTQQFPALCAYLKKRGITLPDWLETALHTGAPWKNREDFMRDAPHTNELRKLLTNTISLQTEFIIEQLHQQWPKIQHAAPAHMRHHITRAYNILRTSARGNYALIDYLNFKGSGLNPKERCDGKGWGLLHVLMNMPENVTAQTAPEAFALSAKEILTNRIQCTPHHQLDRYLNPWLKRVDSYTDHSLFE